jgi:hypothetical protein
MEKQKPKHISEFQKGEIITSEKNIKNLRQIETHLNVSTTPYCLLLSVANEKIANNLERFFVDNYNFKLVDFIKKERFINIYYYLEYLKDKNKDTDKFLFNLKEDFLKKFDYKKTENGLFNYNYILTEFHFGRDFIGDFNLKLAIILSKERFVSLYYTCYDFTTRGLKFHFE